MNSFWVFFRLSLMSDTSIYGRWKSSGVGGWFFGKLRIGRYLKVVRRSKCGEGTLYVRVISYFTFLHFWILKASFYELGIFQTRVAFFLGEFEALTSRRSPTSCTAPSSLPSKSRRSAGPSWSTGERSWRGTSRSRSRSRVWRARSSISPSSFLCPAEKTSNQDPKPVSKLLLGNILDDGLFLCNNKTLFSQKNLNTHAFLIGLHYFNQVLKVAQIGSVI